MAGLKPHWLKVYFIIVAEMVMVLHLPRQQKRTDRMEVIHIYHTNDLHSHFKDWPRIEALLAERRRWHEDVGDPVYVFDIGDHMDRWHPYSDGTLGKGNVSLLNQAQYDAITIGNNEGITLSHEELNGMYEEANFAVIAANLYHSDSKRPEWVRPYQIYETKSGIRVGVIGLTAFFSQFYALLNWKLTEPIAELGRQLNALQGQVDVTVLLSHLGMDTDEEIARNYPEIDVILGGHTHHIFHEGKIVNQTLLGAAGKYGNYVGHVTLSIDPVTKVISDKKAWLYDTNELPHLDGENERIASLYTKGEQLLQDEVVYLQKDLSTIELATLLCEALLEWCQADGALLNEGLILEQLPKGRVTKFDLLQICPHPINPCIVYVTGTELREIVRQTQSDKWLDFRMIGFGFRGTLIGPFVYSQIEMKQNHMYIQGQQVIPDKIYKLAIPDMFTFGKFFSGILYAAKKQYLPPDFMRDLIRWKLKSTTE